MAADQDYQAGYDQGTEDARAARLYDDRLGSKGTGWTRGYRDGYLDHSKPNKP